MDGESRSVCLLDLEPFDFRRVKPLIIKKKKVVFIKKRSGEDVAVKKISA